MATGALPDAAVSADSEAWKRILARSPAAAEIIKCMWPCIFCVSFHNDLCCVNACHRCVPTWKMTSYVLLSDVESRSSKETDKRGSSQAQTIHWYGLFPYCFRGRQDFCLFLSW